MPVCTVMGVACRFSAGGGVAPGVISDASLISTSALVIDAWKPSMPTSATLPEAFSAKKLL